MLTLPFFVPDNIHARFIPANPSAYYTRNGFPWGNEEEAVIAAAEGLAVALQVHVHEQEGRSSIDHAYFRIKKLHPFDSRATADAVFGYLLHHWAFGRELYPLKTYAVIVKEAA